MVLALAAGVGRAGDDDFPKPILGALLDVRGAFTDETTSWLDAGLGKTRYGGEDGDSRIVGRAGQAAALLGVALTDELWGRVQINLDLDPDPLFTDKWSDRIRLTEAIVSYRPVLSPRFRLTSRAGFLFPFSIESTAKAWTPAYTLTPSAANTWIGEEVRPWAAELGFMLMPEGHEISFAGAGFVANDTAGSLLVWRGFALHDRITGEDEFLPFAPLPSIEEGGPFAKNSRWVDPTREIDGRLGYWLNAGYNNVGRFEIRAFRYDNRGDPFAFDGAQYAWRTRFTNLTVIVSLPKGAEILSQALWGDTFMGPRAADVDFRTAYLLFTVPFGRHRLTARYDAFEVEDVDFLQVEDPNDEDGSAVTLAYMLETGKKHRLALELLRVESDRPARADLGLPVSVEELQAQVSFAIWY